MKQVKLIKIPDLKNESSIFIKVCSGQYLILNHETVPTIWESIVQNKNFTQEQCINVLLQHKLEILGNICQKTILKWNEHRPEIYSDNLKGEFITCVFSCFSKKVGFASQLQEHELKEFVSSFLIAEAEYREEYKKATSNFNRVELYQVGYKSPIIKICLYFYEYDDYSKQYIKHIRNTIFNLFDGNIKFSNIALQDFLFKELEYKNTNSNNVFMNFIEGTLECGILHAKQHICTIDELFTMINSAKEAQSSLNKNNSDNNKEESKNSPIEENEEKNNNSIEDNENNEEESKLIKRNTVDKKTYKQNTDKKKLETITNRDIEMEENPKTKETIDKSVCNCDIFINTNTVYDNEILNHPNILNKFTIKHGIDNTKRLIDLCFDIVNIDIDYSSLEEVEGLMGVD